MDKKSSIVAILVASIVLLAPTVVVLPAHALCGPGNARDSWTSGSGATITVNSTACPGTNPHHTTTCTKDSNIVVDSGTAWLSSVDYVQPNTGTRYADTFTIGCSNFSKTYGPFSGDAIPNCAYTDYDLNVHDSVTGETHQLFADSYGQTYGTCPI